MQDGEEGLLRNINTAERLHALLALFLFVQQLLLPRHVTAIALGQYVLTHRLDRAAGDDVIADGGLDGDIEHLARDQLTHLLDQLAATELGVVLVGDDRQRIDALVVDQDVQTHHVGGLETLEAIIQRRITTTGGLQTVEEVENRSEEHT